MNETIVKTEKLTELKNLVSKVERLEKEYLKIDYLYDMQEKLTEIFILNKQINELIKTL